MRLDRFLAETGNGSRTEVKKLISAGFVSVNGNVCRDPSAKILEDADEIRINGKPVAEYCMLHGLIWNEEIRQTIQNRVKSLGTQIIAAKGRTHYGIATCVCMLADAVLHQKETVASVTSRLNGEYGLHEVALSLPCIISGKGIVRKQMSILTDEEQAKLKNSADKLASTLMEMS